MKLIPIDLDADTSGEVFASEDCQTLIKIYEEYYPAIGYHLPWVGYFIIKNKKVVGSCGFTGQPKEQKVEIAYWTFKEFEGQGIASFACKELVSIAQKIDPSIIITAKTAPEKNASVAILSRNGFVYSGIVQDHEIGDAWLWIHQGNQISI
jgi:[ribosomal protein S5]-alanine N-acetyltransferase